MSYSFTTTNHFFSGTFTNTYDATSGLTLAAWIKIADFTGANQGFVVMEETLGVRNPSVYVFSQAADNIWLASWDASGNDFAPATAVPAGQWDSASEPQATNTNGWILVMGVVDSTTSRWIYPADKADKVQDTGTNPGSTALKYPIIGNIDNRNGVAGGLVAEVAIWDTAFGDTEFDTLLTTKATGVQPSNLIGYWPLDVDDDSPTNQGNGDMTSDMTNNSSLATYSSDHPTHLSAGGTNESIIVPTGPLR